MSIDESSACTCDYGLVRCYECRGTGEVMHVECYGGPPIELLRICPECDGTGYVACQNCKLGESRRGEE